jgi:exosome complex RNA-binding protein Csl4
MKVTVKDQAGTQSTVTVTDSTKLVRIAPGQTSLAGAEPIQLTDIQPGDRLLVRVQAGDASMAAVSIVAMKQADIAQQQAQVQAAWQHGVGGLVKSVDVEGRTITVDSNGPTATMTVKLAPSAKVKRYAPESVQYEQAQASSIDKIMVGDQLRARGTASPDHTFVADEVVAGSFRNLSGKVTAVDVGAGTVSFVDLATKQAVSLKVTGDTQLRKLDDATADKLAASMKASGGASGAAGAGRPSGGPPAGMSGNAGPAAHGMSEQGSGRPGQGGGGSDMQQALAHAAPIKLTDLKKGDFVMVVASASADNQLGAVTLVSNVEPLLRASPNGSAAMLSSWSMGGGVPGQQ